MRSRHATQVEGGHGGDQKDTQTAVLAHERQRSRGLGSRYVSLWGKRTPDPFGVHRDL